MKDIKGSWEKVPVMDMHLMSRLSPCDSWDRLAPPATLKTGPGLAVTGNGWTDNGAYAEIQLQSVHISVQMK